MNMYDLCRRAAAESAVLLKNDNSLLPLENGTRVAVFGRMQTTYYKCGTGSGGRVNIAKQPRILDSLREESGIVIDENLASLYENWVIDHPYNDGKGMWAGEPWFQEEMPLDEDTVSTAAKRNDVAVVIIGRSAGEDHDNGYAKGGYLLTDDEENMISLVSKSFNKVVVALNVGNIIDLSFVKTYGVSSVIYLFHGGMAGADAEALKEKMIARGIAEEDIAKYDLAEWIGGFDDEEENVKNVVEKIKNHPLIPDVPVHGLIIDIVTGELKVLVDGY